MLETSFPRIPGDIGNATTFAFPVNYASVPGSSAFNTVKALSEGKLDSFIATAKALEALGVDGLTTNCGYLSIFQDELCEELSIPVATSSLLQVPMVQRILPAGRTVGIITFDREALVPEVLRAAGVPKNTLIEGLDGLELNRVILEDEGELDVEQVRRDMVAAAQRLLARDPQVGAIVLECTNMPPYAADIQRECGVPVFSVVSLVNWFQSGLLPKVFPSR